MQVHDALSLFIPAKYRQLWLQKAKAWASGSSKTVSNPYKPIRSRMFTTVGRLTLTDSRNTLLDLTEESIRAELYADDASNLYRSPRGLASGDLTINKAIIASLDLEEEQ